MTKEAVDFSFLVYMKRKFYIKLKKKNTTNFPND